jgi:glycosyltransferase involved in cell wall biosynthesis
MYGGIVNHALLAIFSIFLFHGINLLSTKLRIIVTGLIAQHPNLGGIAWHYLHYILGLSRLGYDIFYFEDSGEYPYNLDGGPTGNNWISRDCTYNTRNLEKILTRYGLKDKWAYRFPHENKWFGISDSHRKRIINSSDMLINVSGTLEKPSEYRHIPHLIYIDTDPVITQVKMAMGEKDFVDRVEAHDIHFSFGELISSGSNNKGITWLPTRQPIFLDEWPSTPRKRERYTTVMSWTSYKPLSYAGQIFGQKDVEFKQFLKLADQVAPVELEVALGRTQHQEWQDGDLKKAPEIVELVGEVTDWSPEDLLRKAGWFVVDSINTCGNLDSYREYIHSSKGEWSVAKNAYVKGQPGWFSERSACYLASGKPVVVQDTGFSSVIPTGEGILSFNNVQEAVEAIDQLEDEYEIHTKAAREIAENYFDSDKVLTNLIDRL